MRCTTDWPSQKYSSMHERMAIANLTLHNLANIDDQLRETLEYIKEEDAMTFKITMSTTEKSFKELYARHNIIVRSLWTAKQRRALLKLSLMTRIMYNMFS